jgi:hypothetical protein
LEMAAGAQRFSLQAMSFAGARALRLDADVPIHTHEDIVPALLARQ